MNRFIKLAVLLCLPSAASVVSPPALADPIERQTSARLDALEKENAALKQRLKHIESSAETSALPPPVPPAESGMLGNPALEARAQDNRVPQFYKNPGVSSPQHHFEVSGSFLYLQPGAGDLEYGTLVTPLPLPSPGWANQAISPNYSPAFSLGLRYMPTESTDVQVSWTYLRSTAGASVSGGPTQMVGPPFEIGPTASVYQNGRGDVTFQYDSAKFDVGQTFCADCAFQLRVFAGAEFAHINQDLTGLFQSADGLTAASNTTSSLFTGIGPRLGMKGQYTLGNFQLFGEMAGAGLIGTAQSRMSFAADFTVAPGLAQPNLQTLTSPNETQVVPSFDTRLGTAYTFPSSSYGQFKIELGYQAAVFMNAVNHYALTQVTVPPAPASVGVFLATVQHLQTNFTTQGPYLTAGWLF